MEPSAQEQKIKAAGRADPTEEEEEEEVLKNHHPVQEEEIPEEKSSCPWKDIRGRKLEAPVKAHQQPHTFSLTGPFCSQFIRISQPWSLKGCFGPQQ